MMSFRFETPLMPKLKRRAGETLTTYKRRTVVAIPSPYFKRVPPDTLALLLRTGKIGRGQFSAGQILRNAYDTVNGSVGNVMDFDRVRCAGSPGSPPPPFRLAAAHEVSRATKLLGSLGWPVVEAVVCRGETIEQFAVAQFGAPSGKPRRRDIDYVGRWLRQSLSLLAA